MVELVGAKLLDWGIGKAADVIFDQSETRLKERLNRDDLQGAIATGVSAAVQAEEVLPQNERLFYPHHYDEIKEFKKAVFSHAVVLDELKRPFNHNGRPRIEYLCAGFKKVSEETKTQLNETALESWLAVFVDAYFQQVQGIQFQVAKQDYCEQLVRFYDKVEFLGIDEIDPNEESKDLETIFVMPNAVAEGNLVSSLTLTINQTLEIFDVQIKPGENWQEALEKATIEHQESLEKTFRVRNDRQRALLQEQREQIRSTESQWSGERILASQLIKQTNSKKLVLLGAPGSGKTTLMSYFAVMVARENFESLGLGKKSESNLDLLPILIRIRDLALNPNLSILEYAKQFAEKSMNCMPLPEGFFEAWLGRGDALILLDGLDEVAEEGKRQVIVSKIDTFLGQHEQNRAIVTSRPAGYRRDFFRTSEYSHYLLQPFDDEQIDLFITKWYTSRTITSAEAERCKTSLKKALNEQDRIKQLAKNPLLLTIIALIHRYQAELPRDRYELYNKAVNTLIRTWDKKREITSHQALQYLKLDDLRRIMEQLAYWIHTQGGTGDTEGGTLIDREELIDQLSKFIRELRKVERHEAKEEAKRFLNHIRERTGLLNEQGQDRYAFVHKTFQEYLAAQEIFDQQADNFDVVLEHIENHLHDSHWREALLLLIAQQRRSNPSKCLRAILNYPDPYGKWLHRNLFFAGICLAENIQVTDEDLSTKILGDLIALEIDNSQSGVIRKQVFRTLCSLYETEFAPLALKRLEQADVEKVGKVRLQQYRAALGEEEKAIAELLSLIQHENAGVRSRAADALGKLGNASEDVLKGLLSLIQHENAGVRSRAADALGKLGNASEDVLKGLLSLIQHENAGVRSRAADALGKLGNASEDVLKGLLSLIQHENDYVRSRAADALGNLGNASEDVLKGLLSLIQDENDDVRYSAADALGKLGNASEDVLKGLLSLIQDENAGVRSSAAVALGNLGNASEDVLKGLLSLIQHENDGVRSSAADALGNLGNASEDVLKGLLSLIQDENAGVRSSAAVALGNLGNASEDVLKGLLSLIQHEEDYVRYSAADALGKLGNASEEVLKGLLSLIQHENDDVRSSAAYALGNLGNASEDVLKGLLSLIQDENAGVRYSAADALGNLGNASEDVLKGLLSLIQDENAGVRSRAAYALGNLGKKDQEKGTNQLVQWLEQNSGQTGATEAIGVLWNLVVGDE